MRTKKKKKDKRQVNGKICIIKPGPHLSLQPQGLRAQRPHSELRHSANRLRGLAPLPREIRVSTWVGVTGLPEKYAENDML